MTHSVSPALVVRIFVTCPSRAVAMSKPMPKSPNWPCREFPVQPVRSALFRRSMSIPLRLSFTQTCPFRGVLFLPGNWTVTTGATPLGRARKSSKELSTSSARHCHGAKSMSPSSDRAGDVV